MRFIFVALTAFAFVKCQQNEGESCTVENTNTKGRCTPLDKCKTAKDNFQQKGIRPTFCSYSAYGNSLVCCSDQSSKPQETNTVPDDRPVWGSAPSRDKRRVCERKCEEYSRGVVVNLGYIPLLIETEKENISAPKCEYNGVELIVGGVDAKRGEFPHMAAIGWTSFEGGYVFYCGGSLISPKFVMTAGHCLQFQDTRVTKPEPVVVRLGDQNIDPSVNDGANPIDVGILRAHKHPSYESPSTYDDIALLELNSEVKFNDAIRPACLWTRLDFGTHAKAVATGWGVTETDSRATNLSKELQKVSLSLLENNYCDTLLKSIRYRNWSGFRDTQMCAGELRGGKDTCQGDSGSPLQVVSKDNQCIFYVVGVTSFGRRCGEVGRPAVYTRVAAYIPWIESVVWPGL